MDEDEYLLTVKPYRPLDATSTPVSTSPSSPFPHQALQGPPDTAGPLSSRGTSPDITSSPSELSCQRGGPSPPTSAKGPLRPRGVQQSTVPRPELVDAEIRPGPEDAEGSTRRWAFRSRKANQLQPYRFDRLQYKQQLRWNPDAVVSPPRRRRSSPGSAMDQDFIVEDAEGNIQESGELSGLTFTGEEESQSWPRDIHSHCRTVPSPRVSPHNPTPPQWFLEGMNEISDMDSDNDDVFGYLADRSHKEQAATEGNNNGKLPEVSCSLFTWNSAKPNAEGRMRRTQLIHRGGNRDGTLNRHHGFAI